MLCFALFTEGWHYPPVQVFWLSYPCHLLSSLRYEVSLWPGSGRWTSDAWRFFEWLSLFSEVWRNPSVWELQGCEWLSLFSSDFLFFFYFSIFAIVHRPHNECVFRSMSFGQWSSLSDFDWLHSLRNRSSWTLYGGLLWFLVLFSFPLFFVFTICFVFRRTYTRLLGGLWTREFIVKSFSRNRCSCLSFLCLQQFGEIRSPVLCFNLSLSRSLSLSLARRYLVESAKPKSKTPAGDFVTILLARSQTSLLDMNYSMKWTTRKLKYSHVSDFISFDSLSFAFLSSLVLKSWIPSKVQSVLSFPLVDFPPNSPSSLISTPISDLFYFVLSLP